MPFIRKGNCVYRKDTGKKKGCSDSPEKAKKYMKALYAHSEDIEKYATPEEKLFLEGLDDWFGGDTAITGEEQEADAQEQNPQGKKWLRRQALKKKLGGESKFENELNGPLKSSNAGGVNFTQPFDKNGQPRKYLQILLAIEAEPGITKMELYRDILGKDYTPYKVKGQDSASLWTPLKQARLIKTDRNADGKIGYYMGDNWPKYKFNILGDVEDRADHDQATTEEVF
jgi:hypothetical protein